MLVDVVLPDDGPYFLLDGERIAINILYRMLHSTELAAAHSFEDIEFNCSEQSAVKMIGNSIPVRTAAAMIGAVLLPVLQQFDELEELLAA